MNKESIWNLPNKLIIVRFILTIFLVVIFLFIPYTMEKPNLTFTITDNVKVSYLNIALLLIFLLASFTDFLDGYLARKNNIVTNFGKFFDPLADKILVNTTLIFFCSYTYIPVWVVVVFLIRDLLVDGLRMHLSSKNIVLPADKFGKIKTIFQIIGISILFIFHPYVEVGNKFDYNSINHLYLIPLYIALIFSIFSGFRYYYINIKEFY